MRFRTRLMFLILPALLSGCVTLPTAPSVTMAPPAGKGFDVFRGEFETCTQFAAEQMGNSYEYASSQEAQFRYDTVYLRCMLSHGNVIQSPAIRWYQISPPPP